MFLFTSEGVFMGFFDIFRKKGIKQRKNTSKRKHTVRTSTSKTNVFSILNEIEKHKYINDVKTKELYDKAYKQTSGNLIDRHFYYNNAIDYYYGLRHQDKNAIEKCIQYCKEDIEIAPKVLKLMSKDRTFMHYNEEGKLEFIPPRFPSFQRLAIIYENQEKYEEAIELCKLAIKLNLRDGTKTGFEGRIKRLERKLNTSK